MGCDCQVARCTLDSGHQVMTYFIILNHTDETHGGLTIFLEDITLFFLFNSGNLMNFIIHLSSEVRIDDSPSGLLMHKPWEEILCVKSQDSLPFLSLFFCIYPTVTCGPWQGRCQLWPTCADLCLQDLGSEDLENRRTTARCCRPGIRGILRIGIAQKIFSESKASRITKR